MGSAIMKNLSIALFALTGLVPAVSQADVRAPVVSVAIHSSPTDFAPITSPQGTTPGRLRRTDQEQPGEEMAHLTFFTDSTTGKVVTDPTKYSGLLFSMTTDLVDPAAPTVSHLANDRIQLSLVPFRLVQNPDGSVGAKVDYTGIGTNTASTGGVRYVTNNQGNERRNANHPSAYTIGAGNVACVEYNYQPGNTNNTERYMQCFNSAGATIMPQTKIYAKTNDDCSMNQDKASTWIAKVSADKLTTHLVAWRGCNGNGQDDGWGQGFTVKLDSATNPTKATFAQTSDVSLCPREERSHGTCTTSDADPDTAICSWTEGNTQPQRDGTWLAAIDISGKTTGQASIYWKQQIDGRKTLPDGNHTYSMRAMTDRVILPDASGNMVRTNMIVWRSGDVRGNNNTNNGKGGTYFSNQMGVIQADKTGMKYVVPLQDMSQKLLGLDGTHLGMTYGVFGTSDKPVPGIAFISGSHTGAGYGGQMRVVGIDMAGGTMNDLGATTIGPYDRHLYSNYLGNNPGNQGRNFIGTEHIANPFANGTPGENKTLMVFASTSKPTDEQPSATCLDCAKIKNAAFITIVPVSQGSMQAPGTGSGSGSGSNVGQGSGSGSDQGSGSDTQATDTATDPGASLGGCSTTNGTAGATSLLLIGLAAFTRRRRSKK
jgi:MYXO-CTERM domain-containing protein